MIQESKVSVVLPTCNSEKHIAECLRSILGQTFGNFEVLVINEYDSTDDTVKIVQSFNDKRIRILQNTEKLGLAESLNRGIREAHGIYIARMDSDDLSYPERFQKQVDFMDKHPNVAVCGSWQHHFGRYTSDHKPPKTHEELRASLIFNCDICHSTLLLRKDAFVKNDLWYDKDSLEEDYELWTRAVNKVGFYTVQEILGEYRAEEGNVTLKKIERLEFEHRRITARNLKQQLNFNLPEDDLVLCSWWTNPFANDPELLKREREFLRRVKTQNDRLKVYNSDALEKVIKAREIWASSEIYISPNITSEEKQRRSSLLKRIAIAVIYPFYRPFYRKVVAPIEEANSKLNESIKRIEETNRIIDEFRLFTDSRIQNAEQLIVSTVDNRIWKAEENLSQTIDSRIWKAEENLSQTIDNRIWKAEENLSQTIDSRIWKAEENLSQTIDSRIWKAEENLSQATDNRIWKAENNTIEAIKLKGTTTYEIVKSSSKIMNVLSMLSMVNIMTNKEITRANLDLIEIEIFSYCNRSCWFCPNRFIDRHSENHFMPEDMYEKILSELKEINFEGIISYSRYNEPLADRVILSRVRKAREYCPNAFIRTNTNGDYLDREYLDELRKAGMNEIEVQCYFEESEERMVEVFEERLIRLLDKLQLSNYEWIWTDAESHLKVRIDYLGMTVWYNSGNMKTQMNSRGKTLDNAPDFIRKAPCATPFHALYVDYNGSYMLCCNVRSDVEKHTKFILGNAKDDSVFDVFMSERLVNYRKVLGGGNNLQSPCNSCRHEMWGWNLIREYMDFLT